MDWRYLDQEDVAKALKAAGSTKTYIDRQDFEAELKLIERSLPTGVDHLATDDQDMSILINDILNEPEYIQMVLNENIIIDGVDWFAQCDPNPTTYFPVAYDPATNIIRAEVRKDAIWPEDAGRGVERAEVDGSARVQRFEWGDEWVFDFYFTVTTSVPNSGSEWMSIAQVKSSTTGAGGVPQAFMTSPPLIMSVLDERLGFELRSDPRDAIPPDENPTPTLLWDTPLRRGHKYHVHLEGRLDPTGAISYLIIQVDDVLVFSGTGMPFGYYCEYNYPKLGLYRDAGSATTQTCEYDDFSMQITLKPIPPGPEAAAYLAVQPSPPTYWYDRAICKFINGLANTGLFAKGVVGFICGVESDVGAMRNIFNPSVLLATEVGTVSHLPAYGFKSEGGVINTGIPANAAPWSKNSGCMAIIVMDGDDVLDGPHAGDRYFTNTIARFDTWARCRMNSETNAFPDNQGAQPGIMVVNRVEAENVRVLFGGGVPVETLPLVTTDFWNENPDNWFYICGASLDRNQAHVGAALWFSGLTPTEEADLVKHLQQLYLDLTAIVTP